MSILETPRIYFKGEVSWDPIVTNNAPDLYDETSCETPLNNIPVVQAVQTYRAQRNRNARCEGNWNPQGTHRVNFFNTEVQGFDAGNGTEVDDPFVSAAANLQGMLVDLEPYGGLTSQIFFDSMRFGVPGGYAITAPRITRFTARYISFSRNPNGGIIAGVASVIWQTSFAKKDGLKIDAFDSAILQQLNAAIEADDVLGLTVRFNAYRTIYFDDPTLTRQGLAAKFALLTARLDSGGFQPNPAKSLLVGTLGLWRKGEPAELPAERTLLSVPNPANTPNARPLPTLASAFARVEGSKLTLDFANSVPEDGVQLVKHNFGTLKVMSGATQVGEIPIEKYSREAYLASSGIVTVELSVDASKTDLQILDSNSVPLLEECRYRAIPLVTNHYRKQNEAEAPATVQLYDRGEPVSVPDDVTVSITAMNADGSTSSDPAPELQKQNDGTLQFVLPVAQAGITAYVLSASSADAPNGGIDPQRNAYTYLRVLPSDADVAALPPTWDNVYQHVLANWNAMAPCMDNWLDLSNPDQIKAYAHIIKRLTDPANFESYRFMPVTRDMSAGARTLLYNFLDASAATAAGSSGGEPAKENLATPRVLQFSRSMRRM